MGAAAVRAPLRRRGARHDRQAVQHQVRLGSSRGVQQRCDSRGTTAGQEQPRRRSEQFTRGATRSRDQRCGGLACTRAQRAARVACPKHGWTGSEIRRHRGTAGAAADTGGALEQSVNHQTRPRCNQATLMMPLRIDQIDRHGRANTDDEERVPGACIVRTDQR
jgi:hypothetical protein